LGALAAVFLAALVAAPTASAGPNPKLKNLNVRLKGTAPGPNYKVKVRMRIRACSSSGPLRIEVVEEKTGFDHPPTVVARNNRTFVRGHRSPCQGYSAHWRLRMKFFGIGKYVVRVHVVDSSGNRSRSLAKKFKTFD
jgi:hypothetical protein